MIHMVVGMTTQTPAITEIALCLVSILLTSVPKRALTTVDHNQAVATAPTRVADTVIVDTDATVNESITGITVNHPFQVGLVLSALHSVLHHLSLCRSRIDGTIVFGCSKDRASSRKDDAESLLLFLFGDCFHWDTHHNLQGRLSSQET